MVFVEHPHYLFRAQKDGVQEDGQTSSEFSSSQTPPSTCILFGLIGVQSTRL